MGNMFVLGGGPQANPIQVLGPVSVFFFSKSPTVKPIINHPIHQLFFFGGLFCIIPNRAVPFVRMVYYGVYHSWAIPYITGLSMWLLTSYEPGDVLLQFLPNSQKWSNMDEPTHYDD